MTEEEKKAINLLKILKLSFKEATSYKVTYTLANGNEYTATVLEDMFKIVLNLIQKQDTEINKLNNVIQNIREEFLKYDWENSTKEQICNQLKSLYESIFMKEDK